MKMALQVGGTPVVDNNRNLINIKGVTENVFTITDNLTVSISPNNGSIQVWTLLASRTPTQLNWASGQSVTLMIANPSNFSITWSSIPVTWVGGSAPGLVTSGFTVIELWKVGSNVYGALVGEVS
jgi:hypothetical protein